jgi:serine/threonine protein kinase
MFDTLGHYKVLERLGAGGLGEVFRARDTRLGRTVAIKVISPDFVREAERRERFRRDARAAASLSHPNIAALYEVGEDQGHYYLVFEYVPGETLKAAIGGRPLNPRRALDYAIQVADALAEAHAEGIAHYDLKPDNIIITPKGNAKILDFGLAGWTSGGAARERTGRAAATAAPIYGEVVGRTVPYMSPEQARGDVVDYRTDIFSLGAVLFEMLTGKPAFAGTTPAAVATQIAQTSSAAPSAVNRSVPAEFDPIVEKLLAKSLDGRYESAATVAAELRSVAAILDVRSGVSEPPALARTRPRQPSRGVWAVVIVAIAAIGIGILIWLATRL